MVIGAVGLVSVAGVALLGIAEASAAGYAAVAGSAAVTLKTATVGGTTVLTNAKGLTLYWFAPDTSAASKCTASCAVSGRRLAITPRPVGA